MCCLGIFGIMGILGFHISKYTYIYSNMMLAIVCFSLFNECSKWRISLQVWDIKNQCTVHQYVCVCKKLSVHHLGYAKVKVFNLRQVNPLLLVILSKYVYVINKSILSKNTKHMQSVLEKINQLHLLFKTLECKTKNIGF